MKKLTFWKSLFLLFALIVGTSTSWAETGTINFGSAAGSTNVNDGSVTGDDSQGNTWTVTTVGTTSFTPNAAYAQIGSGSKPATSITFTTTLANDVNITSFSAKFGGFNSTAGTVTLKVDDTSVGTGSLNAANDVTVSNTSSATGKVLTVTVTGIAKGVKAYYISYTYTSAYTINAQSNNTEWGTVSLSGNVITASPVAGYTYADPAYTVSPANSATVSQNGNAFTVTPSANTTVTINFEAIPTYTVTLSDDSENPLTEATGGAGVTLPSRDAIDVYTFAGWSTTNVITETTVAPTIIPAGTYHPTANITLYPVYTKTVGGGTSEETANVTISQYATAHSWGSSSSDDQKAITLDANVTATVSDGTNSGKYYNDGWRIYQTEDATVTIAATNGGTLKDVTFTFTVANTGTLEYNSSAITSGTAVDVSGASAEFAVGNSGTATNGQVRITAISVNYDLPIAGTTYYWSSPVAAAVETPSIVVADNPFLFSTTATITCATEGATIKYSYDGENWNDYTTALNITATTTIYAKAIKGTDESTVAQVTATKNLAVPTVTVSGDLTLDLNGQTDVNAGTLTAAVKYNNVAVEGATVTWSGDNDAVATIDASTGAVTIKTTGEVTFTATYAGDNTDYAEATGTKTVTVTDSKAPVEDDFTWNLSTDNTTTATEDEMTWVGTYATMAAAKANSTTNTNNYYPGTSGQSYTSTRFYKNSVLTITPAYAIIDKIVFIATTSGYASALSGSTWTNANAEINSPTSSTTFPVTVTPTDGSLPISATIGGTCGFTSVKVYYKVIPLTPGKTYTTLTCKYPLNFTDVSGLEAYIAKNGVSAGSVKMTQVNKVPAGTGLVLKATNPGTAVNVPVFDGTGADDVEGNKMVGSATATTPIAENGGYILSNGVFQPANAGTLAAGKAYLQIAVTSARSLEMSFDDATTGIANLNVDDNFDANAPMYNLAGQRVNKSYKGVVIVNGKKMLNK